MLITHDFRAEWAARMAALRTIAAIGIQANGRRAPNERGTPATPEAAALFDEQDELRERMDRLTERNTALMEAADADTRRALGADGHRALTASERHTITRRLDELEQLQQRYDEIEDELDKPLPRKTRAGAGDQPGSLSFARAPARIAPMINLALPSERPSAAALFGHQAAALDRPSRPEDSFARFLNAVATRDTSYLYSRSQMAGSNTQVGVEGGFAVPPAWSAALLDATFAQSFFLSRCRVVPMTADRQSFPVLNSYDRTKGPGKLTAAKTGEGVAATVQTPNFEELDLSANKVVCYFSVTAEAMQGFVPGTDGALINAAASALAMQIDREIWSGSGVNEMLGVTNSPATIVHPKDASQAANTISYTNLTGMLARLLPSAFNRSAWYASPSTLPQLLGCYLPVMNASNVVGGLLPPMTQLPDGSYAIFGRPLTITDFSPALTSQGDVAMASLDQFCVGFREELRINISTDVLFAEDRVAFKIVQRRAGQPIPSQVFTPAVGSTTLSPFVQLQAR